MSRLLPLLAVRLLLGGVLVGARTATVRGESMAPALLPGERLLVETASYRLRQPRRGEVVVVRVRSEQWLLADLAGGQFVKRVVGLPGETVTMRDGRVHLDGWPLDEPYAAYAGAPPAQTLPPVAVPVGSYYVLGDNRAASDDSRTWGPVSGADIVGRACLVGWPPVALRLL